MATKQRSKRGMTRARRIALAVTTGAVNYDVRQNPDSDNLIEVMAWVCDPSRRALRHTLYQKIREWLWFSEIHPATADVVTKRNERAFQDLLAKAPESDRLFRELL